MTGPEIASSKQENWWEDSVIHYRFVTSKYLSSSQILAYQKRREECKKIVVNLERLMGTSVVQMTDLNFMLELRDRVWNDFDRKLHQRIKERVSIEKEREAKLLLKGGYSFHNRPRKFVPFHSRVLALDLGAHGNATDSGHAGTIDPIFRINESTNEVVNKRRLHLKSIRQKNVERIAHQTKLQGLEPNIDYDELTVIEEKIKEIQQKILEKRPKKKKVKKK